MCSPPPSVCAPLSARMVRQSHCCLLWPGGGGGVELAWRQEIPSVKEEVEVQRNRNTLQNHSLNRYGPDVESQTSGCHNERK